MAQRVEVELDDQGRLVVPHPLQHQLGLFSGATLVVEDETTEVAFVRVHPAQPVVVEKGGILVVQAQAVSDLTMVVRDERERRIEDMVRQVQP